MPRLREVSKDENQDEFVERMYTRLFDDRDPVAEPGTATGTPGNWWTVFALAPRVLKHAVQGFGLYQAGLALDPVLRELGQTRAGWTRGSQFVYSQHCKSCRSLGMSEEMIEAISSWQVADCFSPVQRAVLAYTDCLVLDGGRVPDAVFDALRAHLPDEQILEFTYVVTMYEMHAVISRALRLEWDDRDDPIVEIAAPEGFVGFNVGATIAHQDS